MLYLNLDVDVLKPSWMIFLCGPPMLMMTCMITNDCLISATIVAEIKQSLVITLVIHKTLPITFVAELKQSLVIRHP